MAAFISAKGKPTNFSIVSFTLFCHVKKPGPLSLGLKARLGGLCFIKSQVRANELMYLPSSLSDLKVEIFSSWLPVGRSCPIADPFTNKAAMAKVKKNAFLINVTFLILYTINLFNNYLTFSTIFK